MSRRQRVNPFDRGTAEHVLFDRYRRAAQHAAQVESAARIVAARVDAQLRTAKAEAAAYQAKAESYAQALRALGHGDKIPGQAALPSPTHVERL